MSTNDGDGSAIEAKAREEYEPARGSVPQQIDVAEDEHPIREALGRSSHRKLKAHEGTLGERFAFRYSRSEAFVREYLANAETGCIRAARYELKQHDDETYDSEWFESHTIPELLDEARDVADYYPVIEIHSSPEGASMDRFAIEDNGVGISVDEFVALRELGLSASHDEGTQLGQFGQGVMSVFNATGEYGVANLETWSRRDGANYRMRFRIDGFNDLPGKRDGYGTTWKIPAFSDEAADMDVEEAVEEYTTAMYVPVIHHMYDESGTEEGKEEYTYSPLSSLVPDTEPAFVYEDEYVEAVMSPAISSPKTYLVSQPIERGCDTRSFDAAEKFHLRIKKEDGCIYESTHEDRDNTGLIPVTADRYENELIKSRGAIHPGQFVPGDLVAYVLDDYDTRVVPRGIDDEMIEALDDVQLVDTDLIDHPETDPSLDPLIIDGPHKGKKLVDEQTWHSIETEVESKFIPYSDVSIAERRDLSGYDIDRNEIPSGYDIPLPQPVDDRDRFEDHDGAMVRAVSKQLNQQLITESKKLFAQINNDGFRAFYDFDDHDRDVFTVAYEEFISKGTDTSPLIVGQSVSELFGISLDTRKTEQLAKLSEEVEFAGRSSLYPNKTGYRSDKKVSEIIRKAGAGGTVYMGATIHADKAELAWGLHDQNQVVAVDGSHLYDEYSRLFGWVPLKELDLRGISEKYDVDEELALKLERGERSSNGGGVSLDELDAATREIKVRDHQKRSYSSTTPKEVKEAFTSDESILYSGSNQFEHLLVFPEPDVGGVRVARSACGGTIGRTVVPRYVADYLEDVENCYVCDNGNYMDAIQEIRESMLEQTASAIDISDLLGYDLDDNGDVVHTYDPFDNAEITVEELRYEDLGENDVGIVLSNQILSMLDEDSGIENKRIYETLTKSLADEEMLSYTTNRIVIMDYDDVERSLLVWEPVREDIDGVDLIRHKDTGYSKRWNAKRFKPSSSLKMDLLFPEEQFPRDTPEWSAMIKSNSYAIKKDRQTGKAVVDLMHHLAKHVPDDEPLFPSQIDDSS